jgi:hypothetical protein
MVNTPILHKGDFVRVKAGSEFRAGQDGMVTDADDGQSVGLLFGCDRHNRQPEDLGVTVTGLTEAWLLAELDLASISH